MREVSFATNYCVQWKRSFQLSKANRPLANRSSGDAGCPPPPKKKTEQVWAGKGSMWLNAWDALLHVKLYRQTRLKHYLPANYAGGNNRWWYAPSSTLRYWYVATETTSTSLSENWGILFHFQCHKKDNVKKIITLYPECNGNIEINMRCVPWKGTHTASISMNGNHCTLCLQSQTFYA